MHIIRQLLALYLSVALIGHSIAQPLVESPWLRHHLPDDIHAYVRIPNPKFYFTLPNPHLSTIQTNPNYQATLKNALSKISTQLVDMAEQPEVEIVRLLLKQLTAPIEIVVAKLDSPIPNIYLATKLHYNSLNTFNKDLAMLSDMLDLTLIPSSDTQGHFHLGANLSGNYHYNPSNQRFLLTIGVSTNTTALITGDTPSKQPPMADLEASIDTSGQGLFAWFAPTPALWAQLPLSKDQRRLMFDTLALHKIDHLVAGFGLADNRITFKASIIMPKVGLRALVPVHKQTADIPYVGHLSSLLSFSLPNENQLDRLVSLFSTDTPENIITYEQSKNEIGESFTTFMQIIGNQFIVFEDDIGSYLALPISANTQLQTLIEQLVAHGISVNYNQKRFNDNTLHHLSLVELISNAMPEEIENKVGTLLPLVSAAYLPANHLYWIEEGDHLIFSSLPQPLIARWQNPSNDTLQHWLDKQPLNIDHSIFTGNLVIRNLSQKSYYRNLKLLQLLADSADIPLALETFPTLNQLTLPRHGSLSLSLRNNADNLSIEYSTPNDIGDTWQAITDGYYTIAGIGILAAIALPAYQDYVERAKHAQAQLSR